MYQIVITGYHLVTMPQTKPYYVYTIEMEDTDKGDRYLVERRYSEFNSLHRTLKKESVTAPFPPKRVRNSNPKLLEHRRLALEQYLQTMLNLTSTKQQVLNFLGIDAGATKNNVVKRPQRTNTQTSTNKLEHHPVLIFQTDPYVHRSKTSLPDIVTSGVLQGMYKS